MPELWRTQASRLQRVAVEVCWRPAQGEVSGDFHDLIDLHDGRVVVMLGDAPASGRAAAEFGEELRAELRKGFLSSDRGPEVLAQVDQKVSRRGAEVMATVVCAVVDPARQVAEVTNAGHLPILVASGL